MAKKPRKSKRFVTIKNDNAGVKTGFVMLGNYMLHSDEFKKLRGNAAKLTLYLQSLYHPSRGEVDLSVREAASYLGATTKTARKAFDELQEAGFIEVASSSVFLGNEGTNKARSWRLTWCGTDKTEPSDTWCEEQRNTLASRERLKQKTREGLQSAKQEST